VYPPVRPCGSSGESRGVFFSDSPSKTESGEVQTTILKLIVVARKAIEQKQREIASVVTQGKGTESRCAELIDAIGLNENKLDLDDLRTELYKP
jgi:hypothetical protein